MEISSFFNSINGDRRYKAEAWAEQIASIITSGILANPANNLRVEPSADMTIVVRPGRAWINGYFYWNKDDLLLTVPTADGILKRIDRIVVRWSLAERKVYTALKKGTPASSPTPPDMQRDANIWELVLADVTVNKGVVTISSANIADTRMLSDLCGKVAPLFEGLDLSDIYEEISRSMTQQIGDWREQTQEQQTQWTQQFSDQKDDYIAWKSTIDAWKDLMMNELGQAGSFNFENLAASPNVRLTAPVTNGLITTETMFIIDTNIKVAEIVTDRSRMASEKILIETETVYKNGMEITRKTEIITNLITGETRTVGII